MLPDFCEPPVGITQENMGISAIGERLYSRVCRYSQDHLFKSMSCNVFDHDIDTVLFYVLQDIEAYNHLSRIRALHEPFHCGIVPLVWDRTPHLG